MTPQQRQPAPSSGLFAWLQGWFRRGRPVPVQLHFVVYTRRGCHLCDIAWEQLRHAQGKYGFTLTATDVDADPRLKQEYGQCVPVVAVNGKVRFRGRINPVLLARLLDGERRRTESARWRTTNG